MRERREQVTPEPPWEQLWIPPEGPYQYPAMTRQLGIRYLTPPNDDLGSLNSRICRPWRYDKDGNQQDLQTTLAVRATFFSLQAGKVIPVTEETAPFLQDPGKSYSPNDIARHHRTGAIPEHILTTLTGITRWSLNQVAPTLVLSKDTIRHHGRPIALREALLQQSLALAGAEYITQRLGGKKPFPCYPLIGSQATTFFASLAVSDSRQLVDSRSPTRIVRQKTLSLQRMGRRPHQLSLVVSGDQIGLDPGERKKLADIPASDLYQLAMFLRPLTPPELCAAKFLTCQGLSGYEVPDADRYEEQLGNMCSIRS